MSFLQGDSAKHGADQQTPFITSAAPGVPFSETDNAPYLSLESRVGEGPERRSRFSFSDKGLPAPASVAASKHSARGARGICIGNFTKCGWGRLWGAPGSAEDAQDTHRGRHAVQASPLPRTPQVTLSKSGDFPGPPSPPLLKKGMVEIWGFQSALLGTPMFPGGASEAFLKGRKRKWGPSPDPRLPPDHSLFSAGSAGVHA